MRRLRCASHPTQEFRFPGLISLSNLNFYVELTLRICVTTMLLLIGLSSGVYAQVSGRGVSSFGGELRGATRFIGKVVCVGCTLEDVQHVHPDQHHLYQLTHNQERVVMEVSQIDDPQLWSYFAWPPQIRVRAEDKLFRQLIAEQNLFKEVEVTGLLRNTRTLDMFSVRVSG